MAYVSKHYLAEKWERLVWDMDILLQSEDDRIPEETVRRCSDNIIDMCNAISKEISKVYWD